MRPAAPLARNPDAGAPDEHAEAVRVGNRLRQLRLRAGLRLRDVAEGAKCSTSMLSKIENGQVSPSINMLHRITRLFGTNIGNLFAPADETAPFVQRAGTRPAIVLDKMRTGDGISLESLTPFEINGHLQAQLHILEPGGSSDGLIQHDGEEVGFVVEGVVELTVGAQTATLHPGDSFFFDSGRPHGYRNLGTAVAKIVWVNSPPTY